MNDCVLVALEARDIQDYIFSSNELVQNIGASELVSRATSLWVFEALNDAGLQHNVGEIRGSKHSYFVQPDTGAYPIGKPAAGDTAHVIYAGGGRALVVVRDTARVKDFIGKLTRRALENAPGLELVAAVIEMDWRNDMLKDKLKLLYREIERRKGAKRISTPVVGLGVTAACAFTGLPAVNRDPYAEKVGEPARLVSDVVNAKLETFEKYRDERLQKLIPHVPDKPDDFVYDFDRLGTEGKASYIAIAHTDGNRMGERFERIGDNFKTPQENDAHAQALTNFSNSISVAATHALKSVIQTLLDNYDTNTHRIKQVIDAPQDPDNPNKRQLPFRPIVFGGDDVTFVCDGRLGLTLTQKYLETYASQRLKDGAYDPATGELNDGDSAHARGGVAIVKTHFPFARAYRLAVELCNSAKEYINERKTKGETDVTAMDWHFAVSGLVRELAQVRLREYETSEGKLYLRPYRLSDEHKDPVHGWRTFAGVMADFQKPQSEDGQWAGRRNKLMALREVLRAGSEETKQFIALNDLEKQMPVIPVKRDMQRKGWQDNECGYFDALEANDLYVAL